MEAPHQNLVMLDFDGVIADSLDEFALAYCQTIRQFGKTVPFSDFRDWYDSSWEKNWLNAGFAEEDVPAVVRVLFTYVDYHRVAPFPGIAECLARLASAARVVIVSTTPEAVIIPFLEQHSLRSHIFTVYSPAFGSAKASLIEAAVRDASVPLHRAVMTGDTAADVAAGKTIGCLTAGVTYGWYTRERIRALAPDTFIENPAELANAILQLLPAPSVPLQLV